MNNNSQPVNWSTLYKLGGLSALLMVVIIVIQGTVSVIAPQPLEGSALDWFLLFQKNTLIGLVDFELLMVIYMVLALPIVLSLYMLLRPVSPSWTILFAILSGLGVVFFIAARPVFEMLYLSNGYAAAVTEAERNIFLAAGESKLATFHGSLFHTSYVVGSLSGLIISFVMLRANVFSKATAYVRIASSVLDFGLYIPSIGLYISMFSVLFLLIWNILIARQLFQLAKATPKKSPSERSGWSVVTNHAG